MRAARATLVVAFPRGDAVAPPCDEFLRGYWTKTSSTPEGSTTWSTRESPTVSGGVTRAAMKLGVVDARIEELQCLRRELAQWVAECDANREESICPVMDHLVS